MNTSTNQYLYQLLKMGTLFLKFSSASSCNMTIFASTSCNEISFHPQRGLSPPCRVRSASKISAFCSRNSTIFALESWLTRPCLSVSIRLMFHQVLNVLRMSFSYCAIRVLTPTTVQHRFTASINVVSYLVAYVKT